MIIPRANRHRNLETTVLENVFEGRPPNTDTSFTSPRASAILALVERLRKEGKLTDEQVNNIKWRKT